MTGVHGSACLHSSQARLLTYFAVASYYQRTMALEGRRWERAMLLRDWHIVEATNMVSFERCASAVQRHADVRDTIPTLRPSLTLSIGKDKRLR